MKFTIDDIKDRERLERMVEKEALQINRSEFSRRGRSLDDIKFAVRQGKVAELYLIENHGYIESDIKYHDLKILNEKGDNGEYIEIKAYSSDAIEAGYLDSEIFRIKNSKWNKSKYLIAFSVHNGEYSFYKKIYLK